MPLEKIFSAEALDFEIDEPFFIVYSPPNPKPQPSVAIEPLNQESENASIQNIDYKGLGRGNG